MTPSEEAEVLSAIKSLPQILREVQTLREAWIGTLDGSKEGGLHKINRMMEDIYHPENPAEAFHVRIKRLEDNHIKRTGFLTAISLVSGAVGWVIMALIYWITGTRK